MRGENEAVEEESLVEEGSPPHARGKLQGSTIYVYSLGLTPTCAGKTLPDKALHLQDARNTFAFPLWGE